MPVTEVQTSAIELLHWRDRLDRMSAKSFSSNHKIVTYHLQVIFVCPTSKRIDNGFFAVVIGKQPRQNNLTGMTGLSDWTVRTVMDELDLNGFLKRLLVKGTPENYYTDSQLYVKPTSRWVPENFRIETKSANRKRIAKCPHCYTTLRTGGYEYICKACGSTFDQPFFVVPTGD